MKNSRIISVFLLFILVGTPCMALDLDSRNLVDNIIKSLKEEREHWIIRPDNFYYIDGIVDSDLRNKPWPEYNERCLVHISTLLMRPKSYIHIEKPVDMTLDGNDLIKMNKVLLQVLYEELHDRYHRKMPKKEIKLKEVPVKPKEKSQIANSDGMTDL
jgi:hypothetical protein